MQIILVRHGQSEANVDPSVLETTIDIISATQATCSLDVQLVAAATQL